MSNIYLLSPTPKEGVISLPMIGFKRVVDSIDFSSCDTLMFTSKQAVVTADSIDKSWRDIPSIAIGSATKAKIESFGAEVIYHPKEFYGERLAEDIESFFRDRKILYLRPSKVMFDSKGYLLSSGIELQEQIIYKTSCISYDISKKPPKGSIIIFTSPSTIHCFLESFEWDSSYKAVVIGNSTKVHLPPDTIVEVASKPLIESCIKRAYDMI